MKVYENISGNSGVLAYEVEEEGILVKFKGGFIYRYTYSMPGKDYVEKMKLLAEEGKGLSTFISRNVKGRYEEIIG